MRVGVRVRRRTSEWRSLASRSLARSLRTRSCHPLDSLARASIWRRAGGRRRGGGGGKGGLSLIHI
eukprot:5963147-Prymnesium_polylepis.1